MRAYAIHKLQLLCRIVIFSANYSTQKLHKQLSSSVP